MNFTIIIEAIEDRFSTKKCKLFGFLFKIIAETRETIQQSKMMRLKIIYSFKIIPLLHLKALISTFFIFLLQNDRLNMRFSKAISPKIRQFGKQNINNLFCISITIDLNILYPKSNGELLQSVFIHNTQNKNIFTKLQLFNHE